MKLGNGDYVSGRVAGSVATFLLISLVVVHTVLWAQTPVNSSSDLLPVPRHFPFILETELPKDELGIALEGVATENRTLIISILNQKYVEEGGMLDLFLESFKQGKDTQPLMKHLLLVAVDQKAFDRCELLKLHCYRLVTEGVDFSSEELYMSDTFIQMMWRRTQFLGDVIKHGYNFIFTDMDVLWLRNPFTKLNHDAEDLQISCDKYNGHPLDKANLINTGFYFVTSNSKTAALFDKWYALRNRTKGMKEQDVLSFLRYRGEFERLGVNLRYLDTLHFSGFCQDSRDIREVHTVHANCCRSVRAKLTDLKAVLEVWNKANGTSNARWPAHNACKNSWKVNTKLI